MILKVSLISLKKLENSAVPCKNEKKQRKKALKVSFLILTFLQNHFGKKTIMNLTKKTR